MCTMGASQLLGGYSEMQVSVILGTLRGAILWGDGVGLWVALSVAERPWEITSPVSLATQ